MTERFARLQGGTVYRIHWKLGADLQIGVCHCGAEHESEDPVELWEWLLGHPVGHQWPPSPETPSPRHLAGARV